MGTWITFSICVIAKSRSDFTSNGPILFKRIKVSVSAYELISSLWKVTASSFYSPWYKLTMHSRIKLHRSLNEALFSLSSLNSLSWYMGQTLINLTKFWYKATGAPNAASFKHLLSLGRKSFFRLTKVQHSG